MKQASRSTQKRRQPSPVLLATLPWLLAALLGSGHSAGATSTSAAACAPEEKGRAGPGTLLIPADLMRWTRESAQHNNLPWMMLLSLIWQESTYCQKTVSRTGAIGLGQLMPRTAAELGIDPSDARQNIEGAARYLSQMSQRYRDWPKAIGAYNAGPGAVDRCSCWNPYPETEQHVLRIIERYNAVVRGLP